MSLTLRAFSPSDPARIQPRADFEAEHRAAGEPLFGPGRPGGVCWTLASDNRRWARPLACGGLEPQGEGRWSAWLYASDLTPRGWAMVRRAFAGAVEATGARRIEVAVRDGGPWAARSRAFAAAKLGLRREGLMRGFGADGCDYWLFAGVRS